MRNALAVFVLLLAVGARAQSDTAKPWIEGEHSSVEKPQNAVIQDLQKWREFWRLIGRSAPAPKVDFDRELLVVIALGRTEAEGGRVVLVKQPDPIDSSRVNVFYSPEIHRPDASLVCSPYAVMKMPSDLSVHIEQNYRGSFIEPRNAPRASKRDDTKVRALIDGIPAASFDGKKP